MEAASPARAFDAAGRAPPLRLSAEPLRQRLLWLTAFSGAFVFMEPGPYEVLSLFTVLFFVATGLSLRAPIMPLVLLLILYDIGFSVAVIPFLSVSKDSMWVAISWYLAATAVFFAAMLGVATQARLEMLMRGYTAAGIIAAIAAIVGYFHLVPEQLSELFVRYGRARGTFNDPNVLGAFLVLPALLVLQRLLADPLRRALRAALLLALFAAAILLSFSRGAWAQFGFAAVVLIALTGLVTPSSRERLRIWVIALVGISALGTFVAALLAIDQVAELFQQRAALEQGYDTGPLGRFGRHFLGLLLALDHPLGIGPRQFGNLYFEDPHNAFLNALLAGGWLSGFCYAAMMLTTLTIGLRFAFVPAPWQRGYLAIYSAFAGVFVESMVIDSNHWRHYFLLLGVLWGLMTASRPYRIRRGG
jgi:O-antigen ligase